MIEALKSDEIVQKVGGRFKLTALIQKRMLELMDGARPLVDRENMTDLETVIQEILQDKIWKSTVERTGGRFYAAYDDESITRALREIAGHRHEIGRERAEVVRERGHEPLVDPPEVQVRDMGQRRHARHCAASRGASRRVSCAHAQAHGPDRAARGRRPRPGGVRRQRSRRRIVGARGRADDVGNTCRPAGARRAAARLLDA